MSYVRAEKALARLLTLNRAFAVWQCDKLVPKSQVLALITLPSCGMICWKKWAEGPWETSTEPSPGYTSTTFILASRTILQNIIIIKLQGSYGPRREKTCLRGFANNTGADQPAHPRSLISAFVIRFVESIICKLGTGEISIFWLVPVAKETGLKLALSETPKTGFVATRPVWILWCFRSSLKIRVHNWKLLFFFFQPKHMVWVLKRTASMRHMLKLMQKKVITILH